MKTATGRAAGIITLAIAASFIGAGMASAEGVPDGVYRGTVNGITMPIWEGKTISENGTRVINRLAGIPAFPGDVYQGASIHNGAPGTHIDYRRLSPELGSFIHDEVTVDAGNPNQLNGTMYFTGFGAVVPVLPFTLTK